MIHFILAAVTTLLSMTIHSDLKTASLWAIVESNLSSVDAWVSVYFSMLQDLQDYFFL